MLIIAFLSLEYKEQGRQTETDGQRTHLGSFIGDHDKFARLRAEHYKMKKDIQLGQQLADEEDDGEDGSESRDPSAGSSNRPGKDDDEDSLDMEL